MLSIVILGVGQSQMRVHQDTLVVNKVGTPNSALDLQLSQLLTPIIAQNLEQWVHIDQDDLNKINICSQRSFRTSTNKTLNPYNFCVQYPNCVFFSALESSCICQ
jgi:hypothetical protein